ncbi:hypothetical protein [Kocuria palustris]|uniref:hypothetical protein n=1 Tax=Kocuria palustris TaxID=71999 RepID=UPI0035E08A2C
MAKKDGKPKKDRGAARRAKAAARAGTRPSPGARTPSQDAANAWRQGVSEATAETVDQMAAHVQTVALQQLEDFGAFPAFLITARRDGEFELDSIEPEDAAELTELHHSDDPEAALRALALEKAPELLGAALALPATLPDRSGAPALVIEIEHRDGVSLTLVQGYRIGGRGGAKTTELEDPTVEQRDASLLRRPRQAEGASHPEASGAAAQPESSETPSSPAAVDPQD